MAMMSVIRRAAFACRVRRRLLSHSAASSAPHAPAPSSLLGYFSHPFHPNDPKVPNPYKHPPTAAPAFHPLTASSPRLSLDFLPGISDLFLSDSHLGLLLLRHKADDLDSQNRSFLVCDPVSRRHELVLPPPFDSFSGGEVAGVALLSRSAADAAARLQFEVVYVAVDGDRPRAWVGSFRDGWCCWNALPRSREVTIDFDLMRFERVCVHAAGGMYWHILNSHFVLALDAATMEFSCLEPPAMMWGMGESRKYRVGEMPEDGQLCVASLEEDAMMLCVRGNGEDSDNGWVLERHTPMREVFDTVPSLPKDPLTRLANLWLSDVDAGRSGRLFVHTSGYGSFAYHMDTGKLECLATEDGSEQPDSGYGGPSLVPDSSTRKRSQKRDAIQSDSERIRVSVRPRFSMRVHG